MACKLDADCPEIKDLLLNTTIAQTCASVNLKSYPSAINGVEQAFLDIFQNKNLTKSGVSESACMSRQVCQLQYDQSYLRKSEGVYDDG